MIGEEMRRQAVTLYGEKGWQIRLAAALHVNVSTIRRWVRSKPPYAAAIAMERLEQAD